MSAILNRINSKATLGDKPEDKSRRVPPIINFILIPLILILGFTTYCLGIYVCEDCFKFKWSVLQPVHKVNKKNICNKCYEERKNF